MRVKILVLGAALLALAGCASGTKELAKSIADKPPSTCQLPVLVQNANNTVETQLVDATGPVCEQHLGEYVKATKYSTCAGFSKENEGMCLMAVSTDGRGGGSGGSNLSQDYQLLIATMQEDRKDRRFFWGKGIDVATFGVDRFYDHKDSESYNEFLTEVAKGRRGDIHVNKSDDGGSGEGGGRGGDGDQYVIIGDENMTTPGLGSVVHDGRNGVVLAPGQNDSVLDPTTNNNQNATAPDNPINQGPLVAPNDSDGSNNSSVLPSLL